jgi:hypothetical protein
MTGRPGGEHRGSPAKSKARSLDPGLDEDVAAVIEEADPTIRRLRAHGRWGS